MLCVAFVQSQDFFTRNASTNYFNDKSMIFEVILSLSFHVSSILDVVSVE